MQTTQTLQTVEAKDMQSSASNLPSDNADNSIAGVFVGSGVSLLGFLILIILLA